MSGQRRGGRCLDLCVTRWSRLCLVRDMGMDMGMDMDIAMDIAMDVGDQAIDQRLGTWDLAVSRRIVVCILHQALGVV